jgi:hypothetical protein
MFLLPPQYERLRVERQGLKMEVGALLGELSKVKALVDEERAIVSMQVWTHPSARFTPWRWH